MPVLTIPTCYKENTCVFPQDLKLSLWGKSLRWCPQDLLYGGIWDWGIRRHTQQIDVAESSVCHHEKERGRESFGHTRYNRLLSCVVASYTKENSQVKGMDP